MADLAHESLDIWTELEREAGEKLRLMTGLLNFGDPHYGDGGPEGWSLILSMNFGEAFLISIPRDIVGTN